MTTDQTTPMPPEGDDEIDSLVNQRVDGEIAASSVPSHLRDEVERRVTRATLLRSQLLDTPSLIELRESQVAVAMKSTVDPRSRRTGPRMSRSGLGIAASFVVVLSASFLVARQSDSQQDDIADGIASTLTAAAAPEVGDPTPVDPPEALVAAEPQATEDSVVIRTFDESSVPEFSTFEELAEFAASLRSSDSSLDRVEAKSSGIRCVSKSGNTWIVREAVLQGINVEVHVLERGDFAVYDMRNCAVISDRTIDELSIPPG